MDVYTTEEMKYKNGRDAGYKQGYEDGKKDAVKHGRWVRRGNEMKCSKCKFIYYSNHDDFNYCPNCGTRMDGNGDG